MLTALQHRLHNLHKECTAVFRHAHNLNAADAHTLEMLNASDKKVKELRRCIEEVEGKIDELIAAEKEAKEKEEKRQECLRAAKELEDDFAWDDGLYDDDDLI